MPQAGGQTRGYKVHASRWLSSDTPAGLADCSVQSSGGHTLPSDRNANCKSVELCQLCAILTMGLPREGVEG